MTFIGKLFVMINLALSLLMAATAFGLFVGGIDWSDKAGKDGQPGGRLVALQADIKGVLERLPVAEKTWKADRTDLFAGEDTRRTERLWTDAEMAKLAGGKEQVYAVETATPGARPKMALAEVFGQPLMTSEVYDERLLAHQKENDTTRVELEKKVKEDEVLTRKLAGDKEGDHEPRIRGIRRELVEERAKRLALVDEQGITNSLEINVKVDSQLSANRLEALDERIQELVRYLKNKHKVDVPSKWR